MKLKNQTQINVAKEKLIIEEYLNNENILDTNIEIEQVAELVKNAVQTNSNKNLKILFNSLIGIEKLNVFKRLSHNEQVYVMNVLNELSVAKIIEQADPLEAVNYLKMITNQKIIALFKVMSNDDIADILIEMDYKKRKKIINLLEEKEKKIFAKLVIQEKETAGALMSSEYVIVDKTMTVQQAIDRLYENVFEAENISTVYVVTKSNELIGFVTLRKLILAPKNELVENVMNNRFKNVYINDDQEVAADVMQEYDLEMLPVLNNENQLEGIITIDDVIDVFKQENQEDYSIFAGLRTTNNDPNDDYKIIPSLKKRLPWLLGMILLSILVSLSVKQYEKILVETTVLATFITLVNNMTGVPGVQSSAITMMRVVNDNLDKNNEKLKYFLKKQILVILITGLIIGAFDAFLASLIAGESKTKIFIIIFTTVFITSTINSMIGIFSVIGLKKIGKDPAAASGPFMSTIGDLIGVTTYFTIASIVLSF